MTWKRMDLGSYILRLIDIFKNIYKTRGEKTNRYFFFYIYLKEKKYFTMTANIMTYGDLKDCVVREVNYLILYLVNSILPHVKCINSNFKK